MTGMTTKLRTEYENYITLHTKKKLLNSIGKPKSYGHFSDSHFGGEGGGREGVSMIRELFSL